MNTELKAKWVAALRDGKIPQATHRLFDPNTGGMCCLGVLCHVRGATFEFLQHHNSTLDLGDYADDIDREHAGIVRLLANMNDGRGGVQRTFPEIADYIEQNL